MKISLNSCLMRPVLPARLLLLVLRAALLRLLHAACFSLGPGVWVCVCVYLFFLLLFSFLLSLAEPAKHANKKVPRGPPEDPTPILHSPPRKLTVADQQAWKIPPCISNWKNVGGFTIPLDKRLAADGRGLQEQTINNNFATLSESLYIAERKAREELEARAKITAKLRSKEKDQQEAELRDIAAQARAQRAGVGDLSVVGGSGGAGGGGSSSSASSLPLLWPAAPPTVPPAKPAKPPSALSVPP